MSAANSQARRPPNRLVMISQLTATNCQTSIFAYDGLGRRVQDIEETNGLTHMGSVAEGVAVKLQGVLVVDLVVLNRCIGITPPFMDRVDLGNGWGAV